MPTSTKTPPGPLTTAAIALETELRRYEETSTGLDKLPLTSDKTLQRARKVLEECAAHQEKLGVLLPAFAEAMREVQNRQQQCMTVTAVGTSRIKDRFEERMQLLERVAALGQQAQDINEPVAAVIATSDAAAPVASDVLKSLDEVVRRTEAAIAEAEVLHRAAQESEWLDIARDTDALRSQLQSARNKVLSAQRAVAARSPS